MLIHAVRVFFATACLLAISCGSNESSSGDNSSVVDDSTVTALKAPIQIEVIKTN